MDVIHVWLRDDADISELYLIFERQHSRAPISREFNLIVHDATPFSIAGFVVDDDLQHVNGTDPVTGMSAPIVMLITPSTVRRLAWLDAEPVATIVEDGSYEERFHLIRRNKSLWDPLYKARIAKSWLS